MTHIMDYNSKPIIADKPFRRYSFYLDLVNSPKILLQLNKHIKDLGGRVESFLHRNVKYVVTNRPEDVWPPKDIKCVALDLPNDQMVNNNHSSISSNKPEFFSRGSRLLSLTKQHEINMSKPRAGGRDVLELARMWNIKLIKAIDMIEFCEKHLSPVKTNTLPPDAKQLVKLKSPFMIVEDNQLKYKPNYKELYEWPQINYEFNELLCPFAKKKVQKELMEETVESLEGLAVKNKFNDKLTNTLVEDKSREKTSTKNQSLMKKKLIRKRRTPYYCEICGTEFEDLFQHLKTEFHESFTNNTDNYRELRGVILSLPPIEEINNTAKRLQFDGKSESSESEEESCSPFQSTPNMSTTIQLCGSKHKSHFLPIHDLINNKSPQENGVVNHMELKSDSDEESKTDLEFIPPSVSSIVKNSAQNHNSLYNNCFDLNSEMSEEFDC